MLFIGSILIVLRIHVFLLNIRCGHFFVELDIAFKIVECMSVRACIRACVLSLTFIVTF